MPSSDLKTEVAPWEIQGKVAGKTVLRRVLPWLVALLLLALIGWGLRPQQVIVEIGTAARGPLTVYVSEEGKTRVRNRFTVAAPASGKMRRVSLKPGDAVVAGETLLTVIEPESAPLLDARARLQAEAMVSMQEASRKRAEEALSARLSALKVAQADRERTRAVIREGTLSASERDRAEADAAMKAAEMRAAEFSLQVIDHELAQARATLQRPDSVISADLIAVKSPVSGQVLKVLQESEISVRSGMAIMEIGNPADLEIEAEILSRDAVAIVPGDAVEIGQWGGDSILRGHVRRIEPAAFTKTSALGVEEQRVIVLCDLTEPPEALKALGDRFRVEVRVAIWHAADVLTVPAGALFRQGDQWKAYILRGGVAKLIPIEAGHSDGRFTEILSGLSAGEPVLLHPPDAVEDGTAVTVRHK